MGVLAYLGGFSKSKSSWFKALENAAKDQVAETQEKMECGNILEFPQQNTPWLSFCGLGTL